MSLERPNPVPVRDDNTGGKVIAVVLIGLVLLGVAGYLYLTSASF